MKKSQMWKVHATLPRGYRIVIWRETLEDAREKAQKLCVYGHHYVNPKNQVEEFTPPNQILNVKIYPPRLRSKPKPVAGDIIIRQEEVRDGQ